MGLAPGQIIGPYALLNPLGKGMFGEVWHARHEDLHVERALKVPTDPQYIRQLRTEGQLMFDLEHENIVRVFDLNSRNDPPYIAMEYVAGVSLRRKLAATGRLDVAEAVGILRQILSAMVYAHSRGVLHRDLKPENILRTANGIVKVTDFGLGKVEAHLAQSILHSGSLVNADGRSVSGTIEYMSPQQKEGKEPDVRDDVYAGGVIACELLSGSRHPVGIARRLEKAGVDPRFGGVLEKALEEEPSDRYSGAAEMLADIEAAFAPPSAAADVADPFMPYSPTPARRASRSSRAAAFVNSIGMNLVRIEPGTFLMGSPHDEPDSFDNEIQHRVTLTQPFYMSRTPVTQSQWWEVMGNDPSHFKDYDSPVERVSWYDAVAFCEKLGLMDRKRYRLPTEAEWEYACRAGTSYGGTGNIRKMGWYQGNSGNKTHPVAQMEPNAWGLYDMHGNVWEWCSDWYGDYPQHSTVDPNGPANGTARVLRGGSWDLKPRYCRCASRIRLAPADRNRSLGFRVCLDP